MNMQKCIKAYINILLFISLLFILTIPIHVNAISTDDLDKSGDIGYMRMKLFVKENPNEILVHLLKKDSGEIIDLYTYPQYDYIIDATLPVGDYTVQDVSCKEEISFDVGQTFTIEKNGIAAVKVPQSEVTFEDFDEPLSSDGIGEDIALLDGSSNEATYREEIGDDIIQPKNGKSADVALYTEDTNEKMNDKISTKSKTINAFLVTGTTIIIVGIVGACLVINKENRKKKSLDK